MSVEVKELEYENYGKCVSITNGIIEAYVTIDIGPRIIRFGFVDGPNLLFNDIERKCFAEDKLIGERYGKGNTYYFYGGHRLWISPESIPETYSPDSEPVMYSILPDGVRFTPPQQEENELQLSMELIMNTGNDMMIVHSAQNLCPDSRQFSLWGITMLAKNGLEIFPQNTAETGLLPNRLIVLWPYSKTNDPRLFLGNRFITLKQDPKNTDIFKIGTNNFAGWAAYANDGCVFVKRYVHDYDHTYPDHGASFETYTSEHFLEMETLSPLYEVDFKETVRHVENWSLFRKEEVPSATDENALGAFVKQF